MEAIDERVARRAVRSRRILLMIGLALAVVAITFLWWLQGTSEERALRDLPDDERHALYDRTLENLRTICARENEGLSGFCRRQAKIVIALPECDAGCRSLAKAHLNQSIR